MNTKLEQKIKVSPKLGARIKELPRTPGVYIYRNEQNRVIYVGKAVNLKNRVSSYFQNNNKDPKTTELVKHIASLEWLETGSEFEALVFEADLIKRYKPKYNIRFKDDKNYVYLKISQEDYPNLSVVHQITDHQAEYVGPFTESFALKKALKLARYIYPYCTCNKSSGEICLYYHIGLCPGHGPKYISKKEYQKNIRGLKNLFSGKSKNVEIVFKREMKKASGLKEFEKAARFRDKLFYLRKIKNVTLFSDRDLETDVGLVQLAKALGLQEIPRRIESFDISNILGTSAVGSMVVFKNGISAPSHYRRFQIKTVTGANDFASLAEVVSRRFKEGAKKSSDTSFSESPDLIILDGGKGQLSTVTGSVSIPKEIKVVSLAKRLEEIYTLGSTKGDFSLIRLEYGSESYHLVQRIRDEAHRFAISYHRKVKSKALFETSLDGIFGIGPKTKKKLIIKYGSIEKIRNAPVKELTALVGATITLRIKENLGK